MAKKARGYTVNGVRKALAVNVGGVMKIAAHADCCCEDEFTCSDALEGCDESYDVTLSGFSYFPDGTWELFGSGTPITSWGWAFWDEGDKYSLNL